MGFFRFLAIVLIGLALLMLGADIVTSLESGDIVMRGLTESLALVGADPSEWLERNLPASVYDAVAAILSWPGWATVGVLGLIVGVLSWGRGEGDHDPDRMDD